jgi:chloride channel protein, CIC family
VSVPQSVQKNLWREHQVFLALSIVVGVAAGLAAVLFSVAIEFTSHRLFGLSPSALRLVAIPPLVSIATGVLLAKVFPDVRGSGVPQTEAAYHLAGGIIPAHVPLGKFITGVLCIGSGHSLGREGPSVQIGAGLASVAGRWLELSPERVRDLVPVGAAGALAAAFNTPVAAVLFALEEVIGDLNAALLGSAVVASVAAVVVERSILGNEPLFHLPPYQLVHPAELIAYAGLGIVGGVLSLAFCKGLLATRALFRRLPARTLMIQPAIGGLMIGIVLLYVPQVMGVGYEFVDRALNGGLLLKTLALLCFVKLAATIVSYASGNAGGIFAPSLYIGAMAGGAIGLLIHRIAPFPTADSGAYALVGMGALFAGIVRAPMTSVFMIFEITQDYQILVPLMVANLLSFVISKRYQPVAIYHALLQQDGVHLPTATEPTQIGRTAGQLMRRDVRFLAADLSVDDAWRLAKEDGAPAYLVGTAENLEGTITRRRLEASWAGGNREARVAALMDRDVVHAHPDHSLDVVLDRLVTSGGVLAVVSRANAAKVEGVVTADTLLPMGDHVSAQRRNVSDVGTSGSPHSPVRSTIERVRDGKEDPTGVPHLGGGQLAERSLDG